ncbi:hypothetical protein K3495_g151 [Podosphaera aphanis]|nr:hypothetical protein K3495_g151 [Podosphaera aphanis]
MSPTSIDIPRPQTFADQPFQHQNPFAQTTPFKYSNPNILAMTAWSINPQLHYHHTAPTALQTPAPTITKYDGLTNLKQFIEDLEARFILQSLYHSKDRQKVMVVVECLEGTSPDRSSEAPKEWAKLEVLLSPELKYNWLAFAQTLRDRYLSPSVTHMRIQPRQTLKQDLKTVQQSHNDLNSCVKKLVFRAKSGARTSSSLEEIKPTENDLIDEMLINSLVLKDAQQGNENVIIPENLKFLSEAFSKSSAAKLSSHRDGVDMTIDIPDGKPPRVIPMSRLSKREKEEAKNQTNELISKVWIRRCKA